ncbi:MAG: PilW family protein [Candidatus Tectomicrobia bacterium]|nr:PilW family protein [Candidatus Tectomicrobia bacterium]
MNRNTSSDGFSLIELLMAMTISLTIIAAVYQLSFSQHRSYRKQDQAVETRQNVRAIMALITKHLQLSGYDPTGRANTGLVTGFAPPHDSFTIDYANEHDIIAFTLDDNGDATAGSDDAEQIAFRLNNETLERYSSENTEWETIATNIDALDFVFLDDTGTKTTDPAEFRAVQIALLVRSTKQDNKYQDTAVYMNKQSDPICPSCPNDHFRRRLLTTTIKLRNLGL